MAGERAAAVSAADVRVHLDGFQQVTSPGCSPRMWKRRFAGEPVVITPTAQELEVLSTAAANVLNALPQLRASLPEMRHQAYPWAGLPRHMRPVGSSGEGLFGDFQRETPSQAEYDIARSLVDGVDGSLRGEQAGWEFAHVAHRIRRGLRNNNLTPSMGVSLELSSGRRGNEVPQLQTSVEELRMLARYPGVFRHLQDHGIQVAKPTA